MKVGILGAGQLCRMLILAGLPLGIEFKVYATSQEHCIHQLGELAVGSWQDKASLAQFAQSCDVITLENENIPVDVLQWISQFTPIYPGINALETSQDRWLEKNLFEALAIPNIEFARVDTQEDALVFLETFDYPAILKKRRNGYDGKGQWRLETLADLQALDAASFEACIIEKVAPFQREVSIIGVRDHQGQIVYYDLCENYHQQGILRYTHNKMDDPSFQQAKELLDKVLSKLNYIGCCALELFDVDGTLYANEMAPRVHNSGHWTIEGAQTSQFENHLRAILNWPMGSTRSLGHYKMENILGEFPDKQMVLQSPDKHLHDYGKSFKPNRKRGHVTSVCR